LASFSFFVPQKKQAALRVACHWRKRICAYLVNVFFDHTILELVVLGASEYVLTPT
jgi:hypothetical protein